jgi:DNA-binding NarL/FixJ family response regulator
VRAAVSDAMLENYWATNAVDLLKLVETVRPDRFVVDIQMSSSDPVEGWGAARRDTGAEPIALSIQMNSSDVADVIRLVAVGGHVDADESDAASKRRSHPPDVWCRDDHLGDLTAREIEVLGLMAQGLSNTGIARKLWITGSTVEKHVRNVMRRLEVDGGEESHRRVLAVLAFLTHERRSV